LFVCRFLVPCIFVLPAILGALCLFFACVCYFIVSLMACGGVVSLMLGVATWRLHGGVVSLWLHAVYMEVWFPSCWVWVHAMYMEVWFPSCWVWLHAMYMEVWFPSCWVWLHARVCMYMEPLMLGGSLAHGGVVSQC
jgi:hypothetical protein